MSATIQYLISLNEMWAKGYGNYIVCVFAKFGKTMNIAGSNELLANFITFSKT